MKLSTAGSARGAREELRERHRRDRAAAQQMRQQYPSVASIRIDLEFGDEVTPLPAPQSFILHPPARAYFVFPCPYADCEGEFDLAKIVSTLQRAGETQVDGQMKCCGHRFGADPDGRRSCTLQLEYTISIAAE